MKLLEKYLHEAIDTMERDKIRMKVFGDVTALSPELQALVANMGVRSKAAQALFLHRNTLLLRIQRMEEITGRDLSRSETLLEMGMALRVRPML